MTNNIEKFIGNVNTMERNEKFTLRYADDRNTFFRGDVISTVRNRYALITAGSVTEFDDASSMEGKIILYSRIMADNDVRFITVMELGGYEGFNDEQWKVGDLEERE